jgi:uncharacterized protein (TIGR02996 family)
MPTSVDRAGLLGAIIGEPDDDGLRLIYADALDDDGQIDRAAYVRAKIRLEAVDARLGAIKSILFAPGGLGSGRFRDSVALVAEQGALTVERDQLLVRFTPQKAWPDSMTSLTDEPDRFPEYRGWSWLWRRGFVESVKCPLAQWLAHGPAVARAHPLVEVALTDRCAWIDCAWIDGPEEHSVYWWSLGVGQARSDSQWVLPVPIFRLLSGVAFYRDGGSCKIYRGEDSVLANDAANATLSAALIAWARLPEKERRAP